MFGDWCKGHEWGQGCYWYLGMLNMLYCTGQAPTTRNYPAQNVNSAKVVKPWPKEMTQKAELKFRLSLRSLLKLLLSPWKHAVRLCHSSSKFLDSSYLPAHKILQDLLTLLLYSHFLLFSNKFFLLAKMSCSIAWFSLPERLLPSK